MNKKPETFPKTQSRRTKAKVKTQQLYVLASHLGTLLEAGVPLLTCLSILAEQTKEKDLKEVLHRIIVDINQGSNLAQALAKFPHTFPTLFITMIKAGEKTGHMVQVLKQLSDYMKTQDEMERKIKAAVSYPTFVLSFFLLVLLAMVFGLIPKFQSMFESFNSQLPIPTQILIAVSDFAKRNLVYEISIVVILVLVARRYRQHPTVRMHLDRLKLTVPLIGEMILHSLLSKFCRTLSLLLRSGVSLVDSIDIAAMVSDNVVLQTALKKVKQGVIEGQSLHKLLARAPVFPVLMVQMVSVGESSGALDQMLDKVSEIYEGQLNHKIAGLSSIIEPALMVCLGMVALVVIIALYLPIFNLSGAIH